MKTNLVLPVLVAGIAQAELSPLSDYVKPYVDGRYRYEDRTMSDGYADVGTANTRSLSFQAGAKITGEWGFGGLVEYEVTQNFEEVTTLDPDQTGFNQYYPSCTNGETVVKYGRQQINLGAITAEGGQAFVGGVAWRQNEQTYDALSLSTKAIGDLSLFVSYANQVNTIFSTETGGGPPQTSGESWAHDGDFVFVNAEYAGVTAYYYGANYDDNLPAVVQGREGDTFGAFTKLGGLYLEGAVQNGKGYYHIAYTTKVAGKTVKVGAEQLNGGFSTPFATAHKFGGWSDAILGERVNGTGVGTTDFYALVATKLPFGITFKTVGHYITDDTYGEVRGSELDLLLVKPITKGVKAVVKYADFDSAGLGAGGGDREITTAEINFSF